MIEAGPKRVLFGAIGVMLAVVLSAGTVTADYAYLTSDPRAAHEKLITDMQNGQVDLHNIAPAAQEQLRRFSHGTMSFPTLAAMGTLQKICPTLVVQYPKGQTLAFRAVHESGHMDWVVAVSRDPETVQSVVFMAGRNGPPAILPPYTPGGLDKLMPSAELDCLPANSKPASDEELRAACQHWPAMCE